MYIAFMVKLGYRDNVASYMAMINALAFSSGQFKEAMENGIFVRKQSTLFRNEAKLVRLSGKIQRELMEKNGKKVAMQSQHHSKRTKNSKNVNGY